MRRRILWLAAGLGLLLLGMWRIIDPGSIRAESELKRRTELYPQSWRGR